jgi:predicted metalloprotease with PDZ domain
MATLVADLNAVQPHDWAGHLAQRLHARGDGAPLQGFTLAGWKLAYTDTPTAAFTEASRRQLNLAFSGGLVMATAGKVDGVVWGSAAFDAGIVVGDTLLAVNERPYSDDELKAAVVAAKASGQPIRLTVKSGERVRSVDWAWAGGLRYPRLERLAPADPKRPTGLERLLAPR